MPDEKELMKQFERECEKDCNLVMDRDHAGRYRDHTTSNCFNAWKIGIRANTASNAETVPIARLLTWVGPKHDPEPPLCARTYEEYPKEAVAKDKCWEEGAPLYTDPPRVYRTYTYEHQPDNVTAYRLGSVLRLASGDSAGDNIDVGLNLLKRLKDKGYGIFELGEEKTNEQCTSTAEAVPVDAIGTILTHVMDNAVANGANSVSMPEKCVEVAIWLCDIKLDASQLVISEVPIAALAWVFLTSMNISVRNLAARGPRTIDYMEAAEWIRKMHEADTKDKSND